MPRKSLRTAARQVQLRFDPFIAVAPQPRVELERRVECGTIAHDRSIRADQEGQRPQQPRRDLRQRAPFEDRLACVPEASRLQRAQPAVRGTLVVERRRRGEVAFVDERDADPALRCRQRRRQPVNAAADDEEIELLRSQSRKIPRLHP
jgi:hypothetical protein